MLKVNNVDVFYGKVQALFQVSFEANSDEIVSIIGANGAGKNDADENDRRRQYPSLRYDRV